MLADILDVQIDLATTDCTGQIAGGFIQAFGYLHRLRPFGPKTKYDPRSRYRFLDHSPTHGFSRLVADIQCSHDTDADALSRKPGLYCFATLVSAKFRTIQGLLVSDTATPGQFQRIGIFSADGLDGLANFRYRLSMATNGEGFMTDEQKNDRDHRNEAWLSTITDEGVDGPGLLYHNDPEVVEGWERFEPQIITII